MTNREYFPIVLNNHKSNLLANNKTVILNGIPQKHPSEIRTRGSMFAHMLNNIKHCVINKSKAKKKIKQQSEKENDKISLEIKNYYLGRRKSTDKLIKFSNSIQINENQRNSYHVTKFLPTRDYVSKKTMPSSQISSPHPSICQIQIMSASFNMKFPSKALQNVCIEPRKQFMELLQPQWTLIISSQFFYASNNTNYKRLARILSEILFEGIDLCIRLSSSKQKQNLPIYIRDLCHLIYPQNSAFPQSHRFFKMPSINFDEKLPFGLNQSSFLANKIMFLEPQEFLYNSKWFFCSNSEDIELAYLNISDLKIIKHMQVMPITLNFKFIFEGQFNQQAKIYTWKSDKKLHQTLKLIKNRQAISKQNKTTQKMKKKFTSIQKQTKAEDTELKQRLIQYCENLYSQKEEQKQLTQNKIPDKLQMATNIPNLSVHKNFKQRLSIPEKQNKNQQDFFILNPITMNPKRLVLAKNPGFMAQQLFKNNMHIVKQIKQYADVVEGLNGLEMNNLQSKHESQNFASLAMKSQNIQFQHQFISEKKNVLGEKPPQNFQKNQIFFQ